jgi:hypothetical protein
MEETGNKIIVLDPGMKPKPFVFRSCHGCQNGIGITKEIVYNKTTILRTFAQDVAVDGFQSGTDQGGFDEFLRRRTAGGGYTCCHCVLFFLMKL